MRKTITISNEVNKALTELAKKEQITHSQVFEIALRFYLKERSKENDIKLSNNTDRRV